jgi:hypothetical protein
LAQYWAEEYDWRAAERAMNAYEHIEGDRRLEHRLEQTSIDR